MTHEDDVRRAAAQMIAAAYKEIHKTPPSGKGWRANGRDIASDIADELRKRQDPPAGDS